MTRLKVIITFRKKPSSKEQTVNKAPAVIYPNIPSSIAPVPHGPDLPVPNPPQGEETGDHSNSSGSVEDFDDTNYSTEKITIENKLYFQKRKRPY